MAVGSFARLISALSAECDELAVRVEDMHRLLSTEEGDARAKTPEFVSAAQDIDFVWQHLSSLSQFLMQVAETTPPSFDVDIEGPLHSIRLSGLRNRLAGEELDDDASRVRPGELEIL